VHVVTTPSARERFTPRELSAAYEDYTERGPQYVNAQTGLKVATYKFGAGVLIVCGEPKSGVVMLATLEEQATAERESEE
jgi:TctA family transporter